eukprot:4260812-Heterocapsa_arctica.AAC.1
MSEEKFDWTLAARFRQSTATCGHADDDSVMLEVRAPSAKRIDKRSAMRMELYERTANDAFDV